jgi:hypothetical protein
MATNVNSQIIKKLAHHLDTDQIVNSYKEHTEYAHSTFDKVIYESSVQEINSSEFSVVYKDVISKNGKTHEYSCKQFITFNSENLISKIKHEEIPGEYERLKEFYHEIGI